MKQSYLTESTLNDILEKIFNLKFIHDKTVPKSNIKNRPDYRSDELMLIVEFDGYLHFSNAKTILADILKDETYSKMGYKIIRIPYFVQLNSETIKYYFNVNFEMNLTYPHGFIDNSAMLPCDFNSLGLKRYNDILNSLPENIQVSIIDSLKMKESHLDTRTIYPI